MIVLSSYFYHYNTPDNHNVNHVIGFFSYYGKMGFRENLKSELSYSGLLVKELAALSGVNKFSIDNYLNTRGQVPSVEAAVKIARVLGVSVEYLVEGEDEGQKDGTLRLSKESRDIARLAEHLSETNRQFVCEFIKWLKSRENAASHSLSNTVLPSPEAPPSTEAR
jgi:transcriptional regulator with XRE-family HTH domain